LCSFYSILDLSNQFHFQVIQPTAEDLSNVEFETSEDVGVVPTFDQMGLREELLRGIYSYGECFDSSVYSSCFIISGFEKPSAIQQRSIKPIIKGRDVIAQ
jgi:ATP-dependent RNA helicase